MGVYSGDFFFILYVSIFVLFFFSFFFYYLLFIVFFILFSFILFFFSFLLHSLVPPLIPPSFYCIPFISSLHYLRPLPALSLSHVSCFSLVIATSDGTNRLHCCSPDFAHLAGSAFTVRKSYTCGCLAIIGTMDCWFGRWIRSVTDYPTQSRARSFVRCLSSNEDASKCHVNLDTLFESTDIILVCSMYASLDAFAYPEFLSAGFLSISIRVAVG
jgi:hypothetical protein